MELSKQNSNLLTAEGTLLYVFEKLELIKTPLATKYLNNLKSRIEKRRNKEVITLLLFLHNGAYPENNKFFSYSTKYKVKAFAKKIMNRLFPKDSAYSESLSNNEDDGPECLNPYNKLQKCISCFTTRKHQNSQNLSLEKEGELLEVNNGKRSEQLEKLYNALLTIKPTSTASERVFSVAGFMKTKIRNRMSPDTLNALIFLKYYFLNK